MGRLDRRTWPLIGTLLGITQEEVVEHLEVDQGADVTMIRKEMEEEEEMMMVVIRNMDLQQNSPILTNSLIL